MINFYPFWNQPSLLLRQLDCHIRLLNQQILQKKALIVFELLCRVGLHFSKFTLIASKCNKSATNIPVYVVYDVCVSK